MSQLKKIYISHNNKKIVLDDIKSSDTIEIIKRKIEMKEGLKAELQRLVFAGKILLNEKTVSECHINNNETLLLLMKVEEIPIIIKMQKGTIIKMLTRKNETIKDLKDKINYSEGINPENQVLIFEGKKLENNKIISDYGIQKESILSLIINMKKILIIIKMQKGTVIKMLVDKNETIRDLKDKIYDKEEIIPRNQVLIFNGKELENNKIINDYGIQNESIIYLNLNLNLNIQIFVKIFVSNFKDYKTLALDVNEFEKIEDIKNKIHKKTKINSKDQKLIFSGKHLEDFKTLNDYKIGNNFTIYLVIQNEPCILQYKMEKIKIRLFGKNFYDNNKNKCYLIIDDKKTELCEFYEDKDSFSNILIKNIHLVINEQLTDISFMFSDCSSLLNISGISNWNTANITKMNNIFSGCSNLLNLPDISNWDVSNVIDMSNMFSNCSLIKNIPNISNWNTKNVINMSNMFYNCSSLITLPDLSKWNTSEVKDMSCMFSKCKSLNKLPNISKWNISKVNLMNRMFSECLALSEIPDITIWDFKNVKKYRNMFQGCSKIVNLRQLYLNIIRNDDLKFFPQIKLRFNDICNITEKLIFNLKQEIKNLIKEDNFSIIEIKKGSLTVILVLKCIIFKILQKLEDKNDFFEFCKNFLKNVKEEIQELFQILKNNIFFTLGSVKPNFAYADIIDISNENGRKLLVNKISEISNIKDKKENCNTSISTDLIIENELNTKILDNNENINIIELSNYINKEDLLNMYNKLSYSANEQEINQRFLIDKLDEFNTHFDIDVENALNKSTFEYKIIHIFSVDKEIDYYNSKKIRCPNIAQKILFHGTKIESNISILSTQFYDSSNHKIGIGVYFTDMPDYAWRYSSENKKRRLEIPKVGDTFSLVVSEIYYDRSKLETVYDNNKKDMIVPDFGIRCSYSNYKGNTLSESSLVNNNRFIGNEFLITNKNQILPLYSITIKRIEYLVVWRDYNFNSYNPNKYSNKTFSKIQEFHNEIKRKITRELDSKIYYEKTTEEALKLIDIKKYNKIIIITNGNNNAKEFINKARMIIGSPVIVAVSAYDIKRHISMVKEIENAILLNGIEYHEKFLKCLIYNDKNGLIDLRKEVINNYSKTIENFDFQEFNDNFMEYPNFKNDGNFGELIYNREEAKEKNSCQIV